MHSIRNNDVPIYEISSKKSFPYWLEERKRRKLLKSDTDMEHRVELLQDFNMPTSCSNVSVTPDCNYIITSGIYRPRMRCHEVSEFALKFERCFDSEVVKFEILSEDYSKLVFLLNDRYLELHSQEGMYYRTRIPNFGRNLVYDHYTCDLNVTSSSEFIFRLNLESGRFYQPYSLENTSGSAVCMNYEYHFLLSGTQNGQLWGFDPRCKQKICSVELGKFLPDVLDESISALCFRDGTNFAAGFGNGIVSLYDVRSPKPLVYKDHKYGEPIKKITFLTSQDGQDYVASADSHSLKIYDRHTVKMLTTIEPTDPTNDFCIFPNSGLILFANDSPYSGIYFVPSLGAAPKWCSFLDNLTDEFEQIQTSQIYDDYKFITRPELEELGLSSLLGTESLRAYMHGFFINIRLYKKVKAAHDPLTYQEFRKKSIRQKIDEERSDRLKLIKLPETNRELAERLLKNKSSITDSDVANPIGDSRFSKMFQDDNFQIDKDNEHYKLLSNIGALKKTKLPKQKTKINENVEDLSDEVELSDRMEEISSDDENLGDYQLSSRFHQAGPFSTKNTELTIEERLAKNGNQSSRIDQEMVYGNKEITFTPDDNKKSYELKKFEQLKAHVKDKSRFLNQSKHNLPLQTKKLLKKGLRRLKRK